MKRIFSLLALVILLNAMVAPIYAQSNTADEQLADLLNQLWWSEAEEGTEEVVEPTVEEVPAETEVDEVAEEVVADTTPEETHDAAEDILDSIEGDNWTFAWPQKIEVMDIKDMMASINTTEVLYDGASVNKYNIFYSESTLSDVSNFDAIQSMEVSVNERKNWMVMLTLDNLNPETKYYVTVTPVHPTDPTADGLKMTSSEVTFTTMASTPVVTPTTKVFEDVSFTQNKNTLTVTWTPTDIVENWVLQVRHKDDGDYTKVGTVGMSSGSYTFTVNKSGSYFLKLHWISDNGDTLWQEQVQNIKVESFEAPEAPVQAAPQVGPTTDLIMMLFILAWLVYGIYRFRRVEQ